MVKPRPRTSKTSQKHVQLPTAAQDAPLPSVLEPSDRVHARSDGEEGENQPGVRIGAGEDDEWSGDSERRRARQWAARGAHSNGVVDDDVWKRTMGETITPEQRDQMGYQRLTAYYCADELRMSLLSTFLKREHAVSPRLVSPSRFISLLLTSRIGYTMMRYMLCTIFLCYRDTNQTSTSARVSPTKPLKPNSSSPSSQKPRKAGTTTHTFLPVSCECYISGARMPIANLGR